MYQLAVSFGSSGALWTFLFKAHKRADEAFAAARRGDSVIEDDYGRRAYITREAVTGVMLENLEETKDGQIECSLHQARVQAQANNRASSDPLLRTAGMLQNNGGMRMQG